MYPLFPKCLQIVYNSGDETIKTVHENGYSVIKVPLRTSYPAGTKLDGKN